MSGVIENILARLGEFEAQDTEDREYTDALFERFDALEARLEALEARLEALEAKAKPGPVFTARAGETFTVKCEIPSCEVCAAQGKI